MSICKLIDFPRLGDEKGALVVMDKSSGVPFDVVRTYYIFDTEKGVIRGRHAHKSLHQVAVCVSGSCHMVLDNGVIKETVFMCSATVAVDLPPMLWHEMHDFSADCILLVVASDYYDEDDYVRDYKDFKKMVSYDS